MKTILVRPGEDAVIVDIENSERAIKKILGSEITILEPFDGAGLDTAILCDEDAKSKSKECCASYSALVAGIGSVIKHIYGTCLLVATDDVTGDFRDLKDYEIEFLAQKMSLKIRGEK